MNGLLERLKSSRAAAGELKATSRTDLWSAYRKAILAEDPEGAISYATKLGLSNGAGTPEAIAGRIELHEIVLSEASRLEREAADVPELEAKRSTAAAKVNAARKELETARKNLAAAADAHQQIEDKLAVGREAGASLRLAEKQYSGLLTARDSRPAEDVMRTAPTGLVQSKRNELGIGLQAD